MKKKLISLIFIGILCLTGCQSEDTTQTPATEATEESDKSDALEEALEDYIIEPNDALKMVFSKSWDVTGTEDVYVLETDGTGMKNEEAFTYECGFDEENNIVLKFIMEGEAEGTTYIATSDATGYGLDLVPVAEGEAMNFFPSDMTLLENADERVAGLAGTWKDDNANKYVFETDGTMTIKGSDGDTPGTWCAIEKEDGTLILNLLVEGGSLEFEYEIQEEGKTLALYNRGAETWYYWYQS